MQAGLPVCQEAGVWLKLSCFESKVVTKAESRALLGTGASGAGGSGAAGLLGGLLVHPSGLCPLLLIGETNRCLDQGYWSRCRCPEGDWCLLPQCPWSGSPGVPAPQIPVLLPSEKPEALKGRESRFRIVHKLVVDI